MMRRLFLALFVMALGATAVAQARTSIEPTPLPDPCIIYKHPAHEQKALAHRAFKMNDWHKPAPTKQQVEQMKRLRHCANRSALPAMRKSWRQAKQRLYRYAAFRKIAPYPGGGTYWAVPWSIVSCESGGSWSAANPSGAVGPYQLLGWGAPYPAVTWKQKMANHRIAAQVYAGGSGASNWVCT